MTVEVAEYGPVDKAALLRRPPIDSLLNSGVPWRTSRVHQYRTPSGVTNWQVVDGSYGQFTVCDSPLTALVGVYQDGLSLVLDAHGRIGWDLSSVQRGREQPFLVAYHRSEIR